MDWITLTVDTSTEAVEAVANLLMEQGAEGVQIEDAADFAHESIDAHGDWFDPSTIAHRTQGAAVIGYYHPKTNVPELKALVEARVRELSTFGLDPGAATVSLGDIEEEDWATTWKQYYHPARISRYLTVVPQWSEYQPSQPGELLLRLDPGMAFGTGTHPTTTLMLQLLEGVIRGGERMIDVGTGSGVLAIAARMMGVEQILATDVDDVAVANAESNIALNPVDHITVKANDLLQGIDMQADLVVANILAEVLVPLIPQVKAVLSPSGHFLLAGIFHDKADLIAATLADNGFTIRQTRYLGDWVAFDAGWPQEDD